MLILLYFICDCPTYSPSSIHKQTAATHLHQGGRKSVSYYIRVRLSNTYGHVVYAE